MDHVPLQGARKERKEGEAEKGKEGTSTEPTVEKQEGEHTRRCAKCWDRRMHEESAHPRTRQPSLQSQG